MKKYAVLVLIVSCFFLFSCGNKNVSAEIKILRIDQKETIYFIDKTDQTEKVKEVFEQLKTAKIENNFNGFSLNLNTNIVGKVKATNQEERTIDLGYNSNISAIVNFKKYRMAGKVILDGFTNTDSVSLSIKTKNKIVLDILNDDNFLYLIGNLEEKTNKISIKNKVDISEFTNQYKPILTSYIDLMEYYKILDIIPNLKDYIDLYHITIVQTTKNTFTLNLQIPIQEYLKEISTSDTISVNLEISCLNLLPIKIESNLDKFMMFLLQSKYMKQYVSIDIEKAIFSFEAKMEYGYYNVNEMIDSEKENYKEIAISNLWRW